MAENQTYQREDFRRQVLKVVLFNIFINDVEDGMQRQEDKTVEKASLVTQMPSNRDNHPFRINLTNTVECF